MFSAAATLSTPRQSHGTLGEAQTAEGKERGGPMNITRFILHDEGSRVVELRDVHPPSIGAAVEIDGHSYRVRHVSIVYRPSLDDTSSETTVWIERTNPAGHSP
jgi:hypothetical protein